MINLEADLVPYCWLYRSAVGEHAERSTGTIHYASQGHFLHEWARNSDDTAFADIVEICGGLAQTSKMLVQRFHEVRVGLNFDAIVGFDLLKPQDISYTYIHIQYAKSNSR